MKSKILSLILVMLLLVATLLSVVSCDDENEGNQENNLVDYVSQLKLDMNSNTYKQEVTIKYHIDGDTTHFYVPTTLDATGVMKARYLAVNTPESTGKIEEWGKAASRFTESKLREATSIIVESDDDSWNYDGNGRYLVWVWYKTSEDAEYRNLNLELLQNGLAVGSKASDSRYGDMAVAAIAQATKEKLYVFSDAKDPDYPYGEAHSITLKELRTNISDYEGKKVSFEGVISFNSDYTAFIEEYDPETDMHYGVQIFYGYISALIKPLAQGNRVRIVGTVSNFHGTWQVSGLSYNPMKPKDPANTSVISKDNEIPFTETAAERYTSSVTLEVGEEEKTFSYQSLVASTSISMKNLVVKDIYTTTSPTADDRGAMTLTCEVDGKTVYVRTGVLKDESGNLITESYFEGATIDVRGLVDYFDSNSEDDEPGNYQIKAYTLEYIIKH